MRKNILIVLFIVLIPLSASATMRVVATTPDLASLAREVGQGLIEVKSIAKGDQDPHFLEAKPSYTVLLNRADLVISVGLDLEVGWLPVLINQSRNPKIQRGRPGYLEATSGIRILEIPTDHVDRSMGDVHPHGNPHYWLNPENGLQIAATVAHRLGELDPAKKDQYLQNLNDFQKRLNAKITGWQEELKPLRGQKIVTHHKSFSYFTDWSGMEVVNLVEPKPGIPPSPAHILKVIEATKTNGVRLILTENYYDPQAAREIASKAGGKALVLPTSVGGSPEAKTYFDLFDVLVSKIKGAL